MIPELHCDAFGELCTITFDPSALAGAFMFTLILALGIWAAVILERGQE